MSKPGNPYHYQPTAMVWDQGHKAGKAEGLSVGEKNLTEAIKELIKTKEFYAGHAGFSVTSYDIRVFLNDRAIKARRKRK